MGLLFRLLDFCPALLEQARKNRVLKTRIASGSLELVEADALDLPFSNESFDAITVAYGLRNFCNRQKFYTEANRVLKHGGALYILEFSQPDAVIRPFYRLYSSLLPALAGLLGAPKDAYAYLNASIKAFPNANALTQELLQAGGFSEVACRRMTLGVVALHCAKKL